MSRIHFSLILLTLFALFGSTVFASPVDRMRERQPQIDRMLMEGLAGETNRGFLEARGEVDSAQAEALRAENADRREVYQTIAQRTNSTVEEVGLQRALRIAQQARPGVWLQDARGRWYRKGDGR